MAEKTCIEKWAENEIKLACKLLPDDDFQKYGINCYESALKAYLCMAQDGHSGMSWNITKNILIRLLNNLPISPITENDEFEDVSFINKHNMKTFQCKRMSALFKDVLSDGSVRYSDLSRDVCIDEKKQEKYHSSIGSKVVDDLFPITLPYYPCVTKFKVYTQDFSINTDKTDNVDYVWVKKVKTPDGVDVSVNKYFDCSEDSFREVSFEEFDEAMRNRGIKWK